MFKQIIDTVNIFFLADSFDEDEDILEKCFAEIFWYSENISSALISNIAM